ncbi:MAG: redoxin domain-containing protein [Chloroflexi bacterium]|nr:redoxin domain-containing protein [Chloroflexota bacterium]
MEPAGWNRRGLALPWRRLPGSLAAVAVASLLVVATVLVAGCAGATPVSDQVADDVGSTPVSQGQNATATPVVAPTPASLIGASAPEITGPTGWVNTEPLTLAGLRGNVVLVDFWTYTCVNCIRTLPYLKDWHEKYATEGLVIVGIHSPEFAFEKLIENVEDAVERYAIPYPVVQDNDLATWRAFQNLYWPAKYLVDAQGVVRYTHFGEGAYDETEAKIRELLTGAGRSVSSVAANPDAGPLPDPRASESVETGQTREIYAGYIRNFSSQVPYVGNTDYYSVPEPDFAFDYVDPGDHRNHFLYLHGLWSNGAESVSHSRETVDFEDYIALRFSGTSANVVVDFSRGAEPFPVVVTLDGGPVPEAQRGPDLSVDADGRTIFLVDAGRMYQIIESPGYGEHALVLTANSSQFAVYAFTFGSYNSGP